MVNDNSKQMEAIEFFKKGNEYCTQGNSEEAIKCYNVAIEKFPNLAEAYYNRGYVYESKQEYDKAILDYAKALELNPNTPNALTNLVNALHQRGVDYTKNKDYAKAYNDYNKALYLNPYKSETFFMRGLTYAQQFKYSEAISDYDKAIELNPNYTEAFLNRGYAFYSIGKNDKTIEDCNKSIDIVYCSDSPQRNKLMAFAYLLRADVFFQMKEYDKAISDYQEVIDTDSSLNNQAYLNSGVAYMGKGDYNNAIISYKKAAQGNRYFALAANYDIGNAYNQMGNYDKAIEYYNLVIEDDTEAEMFDVYYDRGNSYLKKKDYDAAMNDAIKQFGLKNTIRNFNLIIQCIDKIDNRDDSIKEIAKSQILDDYEPFAGSFSKCEMSPIYKELFLRESLIVSWLQVKADELEEGISHYTSKDVVEKLLFYTGNGIKRDVSKFRLGSIDGTNDPTEGDILGQFLNFGKQEMPQGNNEVFIGCFTFNHDDLNQFRLYGKNNGQEATGVNIILKKNLFIQTTESQPSIPPTPPSVSLNNMAYSDSTNVNVEKTESYPLYRCVYVDPETDRVLQLGRKDDYVLYRELKLQEIEDTVADEKVRKYNKRMTETLNKINSELGNIRNLIKGDNSINKNILPALFTNIRYLIKHIDYRTEQECRIIKENYRDSNNSVITEKTNEGGVVRRYVELQDIRDIVKEICFGPQACGLKIFRRRIEQERLCIKCSRSQSKHLGDPRN